MKKICSFTFCSKVAAVILILSLLSFFVIILIEKNINIATRLIFYDMAGGFSLAGLAIFWGSLCAFISTAPGAKIRPLYLNAMVIGLLILGSGVLFFWNIR
jgi:hypothetical protein